LFTRSVSWWICSARGATDRLFLQRRQNISAIVVAICWVAGGQVGLVDDCRAFEFCPVWLVGLFSFTYTYVCI